MRELWVNIAHTSGAKIYSMVLGIFTLFLTARLLGPEGRGTVAVITTWVGMFSTFSYMSLGQVALHRLSNDREKSRFGAILGSLLLLTFMLTLLGWLVAVFMFFVPPEGAFRGLPAAALAVGFLALPFMIWEQYGSSLLMALERLGIYNRYQIIGRTVSVIAIFALVGVLGAGVVGVLWANLLGQVIVALGGITFLFAEIYRRGQKVSPNREEVKALLAGGAMLHLNAIGTFLFISANVLILNHYSGTGQTGYFQLATQLLGVLMIIPQAASMVIYGKVTSLGPNGAWPINRRLLVQVSVGMAALSGIAALLAPWGITLLAGEAFRPAVAPFQWMLPGVIGMTFSTVMAPQWIGRGYFIQAAMLTLFVGAVNLAANFHLIPQYGMMGAVYAFLGTYSVSVVGNGAMAWHCQRMCILNVSERYHE